MQINPNEWRTLLSLAIVTGELDFELEKPDIRAMYCIKRNGVNELRMYVSVISIQGYILNFPDSQPKWKDKYFYIGGDIWGEELTSLIRST